MAGGFALTLVWSAEVHLGISRNYFAGTIEAVAPYTLGLSAFYAVGLLAISPIWAIYNKVGLRRPIHAALLGSISSFLCIFPFVFDQFGGATDVLFGEILDFFAPLTVVGAIVGLVVWRVAYRRTVLKAP